MLAPLPARQALSAEIEDATYAIIMEGMTAYGLERAVRAALHGKHGSKFYPNPPEFRELYDKAMKHHVDMRDRIHRQERWRRERPPELPARSEAEKQRQRDRMTRYYRGSGYDTQGDEADFRSRMEAKYGKELLDSIPDNPNPSAVAGFERPRKII